MSRAVRFKLGTLASLAALGLLLLGAAEVVSEEPVTSTQSGTKTATKTTDAADKVHEEINGVSMVFPPDKCVVLDGCFDVICKAKEDGFLDAEGELVEWEAFESPVKVASVSLYNGANTLQIGDRKVEVFVACNEDNPGGPDGWEIYRKHPMMGSGAKRCGKCHEVQQPGDLAKVGALLPLEKGCSECHEPDDVKDDHAELAQPLGDCRTCHTLHGSTEKHLLKASTKAPCMERHDGGS